MTFYSNKDKQALILKHYSKPLHKGIVKIPQHSVYSNRCVDYIHIKVSYDKIIKNITFDGSGCALLIASTDIVIDELIGKNMDEINVYLQQYNNMIKGLNYDKKIIIKAAVFNNVKKHSNRFECVQIIWQALHKWKDQIS